MPYHQHDSDSSIFLGSEERKDHKYDFYYSRQRGNPTVIARFGEDGDYISGLVFIKSQLNPNKDSLEQLNNFKNGNNETLSLLSTATILSIEQGLLGIDLKNIEKKRNKPK